MAIGSPLDIPGLRLWVSAKNVGLSDSTQMTTWLDLSGNANHLTGVAGSGGAKPLFRTTAGSAGGPAVQFQSGNANQVGGYFTIPAAVFTGLTSGSAWAIVKSAQGQTTLYQIGPAAAGSGHYPFDNVIYEDAFVTARATYVGTFTGTLDQWHRHTVKMSAAGTQAAYRNGTLLNTNARTFGLPTTPKLGGGPAYNFAGHVAAFCVFDHDLTTGEIADLETWGAANPDGGEPVTIPELTGALTGTGTMTATVDTVIAIVTGALTGTGTMSASVDGAVQTGPTPANDAVPLTVRVGNRHITRELSGLAFRKEAIGGVKNITLRLARRLDTFDADLAALSVIDIFDGRSAATIAQGRVSDLGRSASATEGQQHQIVGFGPAQAAADKTFPYILIDQSLENWRRSEYSTKNATTQSDERGINTPVLQVEASEGKTITTSWVGDWINRSARRAGMSVARIACDWDAGVTDSDYQLAAYTRVGSGVSPGNVDTDAAATAGGSLAAKVGDTNFTAGDDVVSLRALRNNTPTTGAEAQWFQFYNVYLLCQRKTAAGADITSGYTTNYVLAHQLVNDLLGRVLDQFDGAGATVNTGGVYEIDQLAYPDGVTAEQVLNDLMVLEPAYRWTTGPNLTGDGYEFRWEPWSTTVRYEVSLDDGGNFPASTQEVYNAVNVRWRDRNGLTRQLSAPLTRACATLDAKGITRTQMLDLGDEIGSAAAATRAGNNFLADHNVPKNAGSLNITRPIRDLQLGRMVEPFEIEEGALIRVRGIESYPDALNANSNDGITVFRIWALNYDSDTGATLELDTDARTTTNALRKLAKRRLRKR